MKIGVFTALFRDRSFEDMLKYLKGLGVGALELASGGTTGSWAACALSGSRFAPSASTITKSASRASAPTGSSGGPNLPFSAHAPTQMQGLCTSAAATAACAGETRQGMSFSGRICVVVQTMTRASRDSSAARRSMSVVFPPPPMMAVTPGFTCSASDSFTAHAPSLFSFLKIASARHFVKNNGILLTMTNTAC